jgi:signal transduction histidine kinase
VLLQPGAFQHAMIGQIAGGSVVTVEDLMAVADEAQQILEYSNQLEAKSAELGRTARALREANEKLTALSVQKDAFLSQISHELRTPMTSIRAFSEILRDGVEMAPADRARYSTIIHDETLRLTRLLDDLLDLAVLENGQVTLNWVEADLGRVIEAAIVASGEAGGGRIAVRREGEERVRLRTDPDRLTQVFINLIVNARKYCDAARPELKIAVRTQGTSAVVDFIDNGRGIPAPAQAVIFEKFARLGDTQKAGGAGLGLAICREIMTRLGGQIAYLPGQGGAAFRVTVPLPAALAA